MRLIPWRRRRIVLDLRPDPSGFDDVIIEILRKAVKVRGGNAEGG